MDKLWIAGNSPEAEEYFAFRAVFETKKAGKLCLHLLGSSAYCVFLDGKFLTDGPYRYDKAHPEYEPVEVHMPAGRHVLQSVVAYIGCDTRILQEEHPYFACDAFLNDVPLSLQWKGIQLDAYHKTGRRINPQLGYSEFVDMNQLPADFLAPCADNAGWFPAEPFAQFDPAPIHIARVQNFPIEARPMGQGYYYNTFGYENDDPPVRFAMRKLDDDAMPAQGAYFRYDLGQVRLFRLIVEIDAEESAVAETAYAELLHDGRVLPFINFSAGQSCNMDRFLLRPGKQVFSTVMHRGGRFVEVHVACPPEKIRSLRVTALERCYFGETKAAFACGDALLERIWKVGVDTLRGCCEDAVIDNPTRERGEWTGDVGNVGLQIMAAAFPDVRLVKRGLQHSAYCADRDGLIAGLVPGGVAYLSTYATQWVDACLDYFKMTGDRSILEELYPYAVNNLRYFLSKTGEQGVCRDVAWTFVDWGYCTNDGETDIALQLYVLFAIRGMLRWGEILGKDEHREEWLRFENKIASVIRAYLQSENYNMERIGLHRAVLSLNAGFFSGPQIRDCIDFIKRHYESAFPNRKDAERLDSPEIARHHLITPYFSHYVFSTVARFGEMKFIQEQIRSCWSWMLEDGRTTWMEVFDARWSHCHQWAGCPTWILSRYGLGLWNRFDLAPDTYEFRLEPGLLEHAEGRMPITGTDQQIEISWNREGDRIRYRLTTPRPIRLLYRDQTLNIEGEWTAEFE